MSVRRLLLLLLLLLTSSMSPVCSLIRENLLAGDFTVNMRLLQVGSSCAALRAPPLTSDPPPQDYPISDVHTILTKAEELRDDS